MDFRSLFYCVNEWFDEFPYNVCNKLDQLSLQPLKDAVEVGDESLVRESLKPFLKLKLWLGCQSGGEILWDAVLNDHLRIASILVEAYANLDVRKPSDELNSTFLHELIKSNDNRHHELAVQMMRRGANVNLGNRYCVTPLDCAIRAESPIDLIVELLKHGARVDCSHVIAARRHPKATDVVAWLVGGFNDVETRCRGVGWALYDCANVVLEENQVLPSVKILLQMNLPVAGLDISGDTLVCAIRMKKIEMVRLLIEHGFDVNKPAKNGKLPLYAAAKLKRSVITEMLIRAGAKLYFCVDGEEKYRRYSIHAACQRKSVENIQLLLRNGADINVTDSDNQTPLSLIELDGHLSKAHQVLLKYLAISISRRIMINDCDLEIIESHPEVHTYYMECLEELEKMKGMKIIYNVLFFSIFQNARVLAFHTRNQNFLESYNGTRRKEEFPFYHKEMDAALDIAKIRKNMLGEKEKAICESLKNILPYVPIERIIYYFYSNNGD